MTPTAEWPVPIHGIVESIITTEQPDETWNVAMLGLHERSDGVHARTWGDTRTKRNLERDGRGYVQFVTDPVAFVDAALDRWEVDEPVLDRSAAWSLIEASPRATGRSNGTDWIDWDLTPQESVVREGVVPIVNRGFGAIIEMTVAASRVGVSGYDATELRSRLDDLARIVRRCGGARERAALERVVTLTDWQPRVAEDDA